MKLEETTRIANGGGAARTANGAARAVAADELDPGANGAPSSPISRRSAAPARCGARKKSSSRRIWSPRPRTLRDALYSIPCSAQHVIDRWDALRALSHTGAKLSESVGDEETGEIAARVARAVKRLRVLRQRATKATGSELERVDAKIIRELEGGAALARRCWPSCARRCCASLGDDPRARKGSKRLRELETESNLPRARLLERRLGSRRLTSG